MRINDFIFKLPQLLGQTQSSLRHRSIQLHLSPGRCTAVSSELWLEAEVEGLTGASAVYWFNDLLPLVKQRWALWEVGALPVRPLHPSEELRPFSVGAQLFSLPPMVWGALPEIAFFASEDETRPPLTYLAIFLEGDHLRAEATNGHYMAWYESPELGAMTPRGLCGLSSAAMLGLARWTELRDVGWCEHALSVTAKGLRGAYKFMPLVRSSQKAEAPPDVLVYPDTRVALLPPQDVKSTISLSSEVRENLSSYLKQFQREAKATKSTSLRVSLSQDLIEMSLVNSNSPTRKLRVESTGEPMLFGVSPDYLETALSVFRGAVSIHLAGPLHVIQFETVARDLNALSTEGHWMVALMSMKL